MEETLNNLISIDDECKRALKEVQERQDNIEYFVNEELSKRKDEIKTKYKFKIDMKKDEYDRKLNEKIEQNELKKRQEIELLQANYETNKDKMIQDIINSII